MFDAEIADAAASEAVARVPVFARRGVEVRAQIGLVGIDVVAAVGFGKEAAEGGVVGQVRERCELQLVERDVRRIEIDRRYGDRGRCKIAQHVAAARRDGDEPLAFLQAQRLEVDDGVFPDLGIDEAAEGERKEPLLDALAGDRLVPMHGLAQPSVAPASKGRLVHGDGILSYGHSSPVRFLVCRAPPRFNGLG